MIRSIYVPHTEETRGHYENLLQDLRRCTPPGLSDGLEDLANDVLSIICSKEDGKGVEEVGTTKHRQLEILLGSSLSRATRDKLFRYGKLLTDFVADSSDPGSGNTGKFSTGVLELEHEADPSSSDEESELALISDQLTQKALKKKKKSKLLQGDKQLTNFAFEGPTGAEEGEFEGFGGGAEQKTGDELDLLADYTDGTEGAPPPILFEEAACNRLYISDCLHRLFPSQLKEECEAQAQRVMGYLREIEVDTFTVETQLMAALGGYDDERVMNWIGDVCASRWEVVYGLAKANASTDRERADVMKSMEQHALNDKKVEQLYQRLTGKEVGLFSKSKREEEEGRERDRKPLRRIDIDSCIFLGERGPHQHKRATVPQGTLKLVYETHDEVRLPPSVMGKPTDALVEISSLPAWCQPSFGSIQRLNAMQSKTFPCAFRSDENMLISAPTGAGKTNVALLAMLRAVENARNPSTGAINLHDLKMVYVAPMKALVQEVVRTFTERLAPLGLQVSELSGDTATSQAQLLQTQLVVATPEKWDIVTRKSVELGIASRLKLLILDEVHLLHNERGAVLEAIVARTLLQQHLRGHGGIRCVGLSATLPNWEDVASFLQVDRERAVFVFDSSYRPIPLEQSFCAVKKIPGKTHATVMNSVVYDKVLECLDRGEQSLVFVHSRKDTAYTASFLQAQAHKEHRGDSIVRPGSDSERILAEAAQGHVGHALQQLLPYGFGIHHAGLSKEERALVEELFAQRHIKVLVCTSTLAWGVNLPANQVIIKGTRVFNSSKGESDLLSALDVLQMFGRAGRAGFGSTLGRATIITSSDDLHYYLCVLNQQLPIESHMMKRVIDTVNAEVVLGHVESTAEGVRWLQRTYLYVRLKKNPELYGARAVSSDPLFLHHLECIVHTCFEELKSAKLVLYDAQSRKVSPTPLGRIASFCYVSATSMNSFGCNITNAMQDSDLFRVFSLSSEFSQIAVRADEQSQLRELIENAPIAVRESRYTPLAKINILLQCYISRKSLEGLPLMSEIGYIKDSAQRILRALYEICVYKEVGRTARQFLELYQMVRHQQWSVESYIRQVEPLLSVKDYRAVLTSIERLRVSWGEMRSWSVEDWGERLRDDRRATAAFDAVHAVPHFRVEASLRPLTRAMIYVDIDITPEFNYIPDVHAPPVRVTELVLMVEHTNGRLLHCETIVLPLSSVVGRYTYSCPPIVVPMTEPRPTHFMVHCISPHWLHAPASTSICLLNLLLPQVAAPLKEVEYTPSMEDERDRLDVPTALSKYQLHELAETLFPFTQFYHHQREVLETILECESESLFVGVPPGGGKTVLAELFVLQFILSSQEAKASAGESDNAAVAAAVKDEKDEERRIGKNPRDQAPAKGHAPKLLYLTVYDDVAARRYMDWAYRFTTLMETTVFLLDDPSAVMSSEGSMKALEESQIIIATGAKLLPLVNQEHPLLGDVTHIIADPIHLLRSSEGRGVEACLARLTAAPLLVNHGRARARLLALSYSLISSAEVCRWLRISTSRQYNFGQSCRSLRVRVEGLELPSGRVRSEVGVISALKLVQLPQHAHQASIIFVPTDKDAEEVAMRVLLRCRNEVPEVALEGVEDQRLGVFLKAGVGFWNRQTTPMDEILLLEKLDTGVARETSTEPLPLILVCAFSIAGRLPAAAAPLVVVTASEQPRVLSAEGEEDSGEKTVSLTAAELLQMTSRSSHVAVLYCPSARRWVWNALLNEPLPLESSLRYPQDFSDSVNAAVVKRRVCNKIDVLRVLQQHYFLFHLKSNPHFYGVESVDDISRYASQLTARVVSHLADHGCLRVVGEREGEDNPHAALIPLPRGQAVVEHTLSMSSVEAVDDGLANLEAINAPLTLAGLLRVVTSSCIELWPETLGEAAQCTSACRSALFTIARLLPESFHVPFVNLDFSEDGIKVFLLTLAYCANFFSLEKPPSDDHPFCAAALSPENAALLCSIPSDVAMELVRDFQSILPAVRRVIGGVVRVLLPTATGGAWAPVCCAMRLAQSVARQQWMDVEPYEWSPRGKTAGKSGPLTLLKASGSVREAKTEGEEGMHFVVHFTGKVKTPSKEVREAENSGDSLWWLCCVLTNKRESEDAKPARVVSVDVVRVPPNTESIDTTVEFSLAALDAYDLDEWNMVMVFANQEQNISADVGVVC